MIDIFMLVTVIVLSLLLLLVSIYLLAFYSHPDDNGIGTGCVCKIIVILSMTLAWAQVLMLPLDVANARGGGGSFRMDIIWQVVYISIGAFVVVIIPACSYFYESDPEWSCWEKFKYSFCYLFIQIIVVCAVLALSYSFLSTAEIPITTINCSLNGLSKSTTALPSNASLNNCYTSKTTLAIDVSFPIYAIGMMSFISWFLFILYGGIGLAALPMDMIYEFCTRPKKINKKILEDLKQEVAVNAVELRELAAEVKKMENQGAMTKGFWSAEKREYKGKFRKLKAAAAILDQQFEIISIQNSINDTSVIGLYFTLIGGIITLIISLIWIVHILVYVVIKQGGQPVHPFLNWVLLFLTEKNVAFVAIGLFALLCLYLLLATIKGNFKFGVRMVLLGTIHPMKKNETYMNSFLFNMMLVLITSVSVTQFCTGAFRDYAVMTDIDIIFSAQIRYMTFFKYFYTYNVFEYSLCGVILLSTLYLIYRPSDVNSMRKMIEKSRVEEPNQDKLLELKNKSDSTIN